MSCLTLTTILVLTLPLITDPLRHLSLSLDFSFLDWNQHDTRCSSRLTVVRNGFLLLLSSLRLYHYLHTVWWKEKTSHYYMCLLLPSIIFFYVIKFWDEIKSHLFRIKAVERESNIIKLPFYDAVIVVRKYLVLMFQRRHGQHFESLAKQTLQNLLTKLPCAW